MHAGRLTLSPARVPLSLGHTADSGGTLRQAVHAWTQDLVDRDACVEEDPGVDPSASNQALGLPDCVAVP